MRKYLKDSNCVYFILLLNSVFYVVYKSKQYDRKKSYKDKLILKENTFDLEIFLKKYI